MKAPFLCLAAILFLSISAHAQNTEQSSTQRGGRLPIWKCETPGGNYSVAVRVMNAVSISSYVADGNVRVMEVNIGTTGGLLPRFYYLEPVGAKSPLGIGQSTIDKAQEIVEEVADRTGQGDLWTEVAKNYPTSTHAHTVEYRVDSLESLDKIYQSAERSFRMQRSGTVTLK